MRNVTINMSLGIRWINCKDAGFIQLEVLYLLGWISRSENAGLCGGGGGGGVVLRRSSPAENHHLWWLGGETASWKMARLGTSWQVIFQQEKEGSEGRDWESTDGTTVPGKAQPLLSSAFRSLFHQENRIRNYCRARVNWYWLECKNKCSCSCKDPFVPLFLY